MKNCPKCKSTRLIKNGFQSGIQRYKCKDCGCNPSVQYVGHPEEFRMEVIRLYLDGMGVRALSRHFKIGVATVIRWVKKIAAALPEPEKPKSISVMQIDEMYHWIGEKKTKFGSGSRFAVRPVECSPTSWVVVEYEPVGVFGLK